MSAGIGCYGDFFVTSVHPEQATLTSPSQMQTGVLAEQQSRQLQATGRTINCFDPLRVIDKRIAVFLQFIDAVVAAQLKTVDRVGQVSGH